MAEQQASPPNPEFKQAIFDQNADLLKTARHYNAEIGGLLAQVLGGQATPTIPPQNVIAKEITV